MRGTVFIVLYHCLGSGLLLSPLPNFHRSKGVVLKKSDNSPSNKILCRRIRQYRTPIYYHIMYLPAGYALHH